MAYRREVKNDDGDGICDGSDNNDEEEAKEEVLQEKRQREGACAQATFP